jgi:hypothetical protein
MADKTISQLEVANTILKTDYIIVDNTEVTRRAEVNSLSSLYATNNNFNTLSSTVNTLAESVARLDGSLINVLSLSGATYTLQLSNLGAYIRKFHSSSHTIVIPDSSAVSFQVGSTFVIRNTSSSSLTISSSPIVTLSYFADLSANILDQYASAQIVCVGTDNWDII